MRLRVTPTSRITHGLSFLKVLFKLFCKRKQQLVRTEMRQKKNRKSSHGSDKWKSYLFMISHVWQKAACTVRCFLFAAIFKAHTPKTLLCTVGNGIQWNSEQQTIGRPSDVAPFFQNIEKMIIWVHSKCIRGNKMFVCSAWTLLVATPHHCTHDQHGHTQLQCQATP